MTLVARCEVPMTLVSRCKVSLTLVARCKVTLAFKVTMTLTGVYKVMLDAKMPVERVAATEGHGAEVAEEVTGILTLAAVAQHVLGRAVHLATVPARTGRPSFVTQSSPLSDGRRRAGEHTCQNGK